MYGRTHAPVCVWWRWSGVGVGELPVVDVATAKLGRPWSSGKKSISLIEGYVTTSVDPAKTFICESQILPLCERRVGVSFLTEVLNTPLVRARGSLPKRRASRAWGGIS